MIEQSDAAVRAIRDVYESDHPRLWRSVYGFSGSRHVADEAVAEAFAQALRRGSEIGDVGAWVWRSAFAIARGELQRRPATGVVDDERGGESEPSGLAELLEALSQLSVADRELLVLCHVGGWTPGDLGPVLGASAGALRVRLHRATRRARALLEKLDEEEHRNA